MVLNIKNKNRLIFQMFQMLKLSCLKARKHIEKAVTTERDNGAH